MNWPRAQTGHRIQIPASLHNATIDAVEAFLKGRWTAGGPAAARPVTQAMVLVVNDTGGGLDAGSVVGLDGPVADDPGGDLDAFLFKDMAFSGITPAEGSHEGRFAVTVEPIHDGYVGRAVVCGIARVQVQIDDADVADYADIDDGETGHLLAAESGSARILWRDGSGTGTVWCVVLLGVGGGTLPDGTAAHQTLNWTLSAGEYKWVPGRTRLQA